MTLQWENILISVPNTNSSINAKNIDLIKSSSGCVKPGEVLAIMGPSGSGKSTLLNALIGQLPNGTLTQGSITYNGEQRQLENWYSTIGVVEQDVLLIDDLTINEILFFSKKFAIKKIKGEINESELHENGNENSSYGDKRIQDVIQYLGLKKVRNNLAKNLSGGEKRRAGIGTILMDNPSILFLDEPTSGLDTTSALKIVSKLKKMSKEQNRTIIITIHQPSLEIFMMFDQLLLLSEGNSLYYGTAAAAEKYLTDLKLQRREYQSLPEYLLQICSDDFKKENPDLFDAENGVFRDIVEKKDKNEYVTKNESYYGKIPNLRDFVYILVRRFKILSRNKWTFTKEIGSFLLVIFIFMLAIKKCCNSLKESILSSSSTEFHDFIIKFMKNYTYLDAVTYFIVIQQLTLSTTRIFNELQLIKSELQKQYYTVSSFYTAILIYELLITTFSNLIIFIGYIIIYDHDEFFFTMLHFLLLPFTIIPLGFLIALITPAVSIIPVFTVIIALFILLPPKVIGFINIYILSHKDMKVYKKLTWLFLISPPHQIQAFIVGIHNKYNKKYGIPFDNDNLALRYLGGKYYSPIIMFCVFLFFMMVFIVLAIITLSIKNGPRIRLKLSKNKK